MKLPAHVIREIAVKSMRSPRAVENAIAGTGKPIVAAAVYQAMREMGLDPPPTGGQADAARGNPTDPETRGSHVRA